MNDTWIGKIKSAYWRTIPYEWRPSQILYRLECWAWRRYTTVKPRYLPHTWCDRCTVMPHMMFELLCQFVEKECSPGHVEWYGDHPHIITVNGEEKNVMDEMKDLITWWHEVWNKEYKEVEDMLWAEANKHAPSDRFEPCEGGYMWEWDFASDDEGELYRRCLDAVNKLERIMSKALENRLHRIVTVIPYMWT